MKAFARVMSLLLALSLLPMAALAENDVHNILSDDPLSSLAAWEGRLYALGGHGLFAVDTAAGALTPIAVAEGWPALEGIFADAQGLLGFASEEAALYRLDVSQTPVQAQRLRAVDAWAGQYMMYMACRAPYLYAFGGNRVRRLHMETGETAALDAGKANGIAAYKDGLLLAVEAERTADGWTRSLYTYDFDAGRKALLAKPQGTLGNTLAYDAATDTVYTSDNRAIHAWKAGDAETTYIAPIPKGDTYALTLLDGQAAVITDGNFLALRPLAAGAYRARRLTVLSPLGRAEDYRSFYREHPETDLVLTADERMSTPEERFIHDMLTQSADVDVYLLTDQNLLERIKQKGFALPLEESPALAAWAERLEQPFRDAVSRDGHVYALLQAVFVNLTVYNRDAFAALALPVPATYEEYYDFCLMWHEKMAEKHPEYRFAPLENGMDLASVLAAVASELERNGQPMDFTAPAIRSLVDKAAQVGRLQTDDSWGAPDWLTYQYYLPRRVDKAEYLLLRLSRDSELTLPVGADDFKYLVVNPYSRNRQAALQLLEGVARDQEQFYAIVLDRTRTDAVENPEFEDMLAAFDGRGEGLSKAIAGAEGAEKRSLEEALRAFETEREAFVRDSQYLFTAQDAARARAIAPHVRIPRYNPIWQLVREYPDMFEEYRTNPDFNVDQFLTRLNGMVATALAEQQ